MKVFIWCIGICIYVLLTILINRNGIILGGVPTALLFGLVFWPVHFFCKKWDKHKENLTKKMNSSTPEEQRSENSRIDKICFCRKCGDKILNNNRFCCNCGNDTLSFSSPKVFNKNQKMKKGNKERICNSTKKHIAFLLLAVVAFVLITSIVVLIIFPCINYNHAQKLLEQGKYDLAYTAFLNLRNYSDSEEKLLEIRYLQANDYRKNGDFDIANDIFETLGDYRDSKSLIHKHEYKITMSTPKTCTVNGSETYTCAFCEHSYITIIKADHTYTLVEETPSSCLSCGEKKFTCLNCNHSYSDTIDIKPHTFKSASCMVPKTCLICGKTEGKALGHSNDLFCTRCGTKTFETIKYSGRGVSNIANINLPKGTYNFTFTHSGSRNFIVYFSKGDHKQNLIVNEIGSVSYVYQVTSYSDFGEIKNGYINITNADGDWTLTIEAVSN